MNYHKPRKKYCSIIKSVIVLSLLSIVYSCQDDIENEITPTALEVSKNHHICTEVSLKNENNEHENNRGAILNNKKWPTGVTLRVKFLSGNSFVQNKVKQYAQTWSKYANITFKFVSSSSNADIKIAFDTTEGSWSYIGKDCQSIPQNKPSMNFGWFNNSTTDTEFRRTTIHEFGHALGFIHEHQHPAAGIPWDKPKVYAFYAGAPNYWDRAKVDQNIFKKYSVFQTNFSSYDKLSIMHYSVPSSLTTTSFSVGNNTVLSTTDKNFVRSVYPFIGLGSFDMAATNDLSVSLDYNGDGYDDVINYRPGKKVFYLQRNNKNETFTSVVKSHNGIGGYDLASTSDRIISLDYNGDEKDDIMLYRPGKKVAFILRSNGNGTFTTVYKSWNGYRGYDLAKSTDKIVALDYNGDGKDEIICFRPGYGVFFLYRSNGTPNFQKITDARSGYGGFDLRRSNDNAIALDYNGDGKDDIGFYRPGSQVFFLLRSNGNNTFTTTIKSFRGIGTRFDLARGNDRLVPLDYNGDGRDDIIAYRPGSKVFYLNRANSNGTFTSVIKSHNGIMGYDLASGYDKVISLDYNNDGKSDILTYRPGKKVVYYGRSTGSNFIREY